MSIILSIIPITAFSVLLATIIAWLLGLPTSQSKKRPVSEANREFTREWLDSFAKNRRDILAKNRDKPPHGH